MKAELAEIADAALHLPTNDKAHLAHQLLESLDEDEIEKKWDEVTARRCDEILRGDARLVSAEEMDERIRVILKK